MIKLLSKLNNLTQLIVLFWLSNSLQKNQIKVKF